MSSVPQPVRVVVVEDSLLQRAHLVRLLTAGGGIEVVGEAASADEAVAVVARARPDVVTMDLEIPGGRGRTPGGTVAIERIMEGPVVPILILSSHASSRDDTLAIDALAAGAVDVFPKRPSWSDADADALRRRVHVLSRLRMVQRRPKAPAAQPGEPARGPGGGEPIIGLASSTGGPSALRTLIGGLAGTRAPILVVQHIHEHFTASFAKWLQDTTGVPAHVAEHGESPTPGHVHVAPSGLHLKLGAGRRLVLAREPDLLSRPSCDELLRSMAETAGSSTVAAVLTGMGEDGARGLLEVRRRGGRTFAQDGATAVVDGMPRAARELGAAGRVLPLEELGPAIADTVRGMR